MYLFFKKMAAVLFLLCVPLHVVYAVPREPRNLTLFVGDAVLGVTDAALNSSPESVAVNLDGYSALTVQVSLTRSAATTVVLSCKQSIDGEVWDAFKKIDMESGSGVGTQLDLTVSEAVSGSGTIIFAPLTFCAKFVKCSLSGASATSLDKVTMKFFAGVL